MRRAKLAPGSVPAGSLPTTTYHSVPRCFVCDEPIKSHRLSTSLLSGRTQYTHSPLPTKIGGYIGDEFVVVVTPQDALCKHCMALINTMDRLELELRQHRYTLTQHLKIKYKLDGHIMKTVSKCETGEDEDNLEEPEIIEVSDEEWTPNKKQRIEPVKQHRCTICHATYTNLNLFMAHLSRHKQMDKTRDSAVSQASSVKLSNPSVGDKSGQVIRFKCGCCSESFLTKESLALHMQQHTAPTIKSRASCVIPNSSSKPTSETVVTMHYSKHEPKVQVSALFEDLEQLSQQDVPVSVGVCTEEQKGRVCLLALLNNGVCSDLSHRSPVECAPLQHTEVASVPKEKNSSDDQTISITVSIPNVLNGGPFSEQQLSFSTVRGNCDTTGLSYPMTISNAPVASSTSQEVCNVRQRHEGSDLKQPLQNFNFSETSESSCSDMPDLSTSTFQTVSKLRGQSVLDSHELSLKGVGSEQISVENVIENVMSVSLPSSDGQTHSMDMPSLMDEDFLHGNEKYQETSNEVKISGEVNSSSEPEKDHVHLRKTSVGGQNQSPPLASSGSVESNSVKNIAIVSVTSVPVTRDSFDSESMATDWFYSAPGKEITSVLEGKSTNEKDLSLESSWFHECGDLSVPDKKSLSENCSSGGRSISNDPCLPPQKLTTEDVKSGDEQETRSKIASFL